MKYFICLMSLLLASCSTAPNRDLLECQENLVKFYHAHKLPAPRDDIEQVCRGEMSRRAMIERMSQRR